MKLLTVLCLLSFSSTYAFQFGNSMNNMGGASLFNEGINFGSHISDSFNKFANPTHSLTYDNPILDFSSKVPVVGPAIDAVATGFRLGEGIGQHVGQIAMDHFNNQPKFPAI